MARNDFESNYLMHWGIKKGAQSKKHKYVERVEKNGRYIYFYTLEEYEKWLHKGDEVLNKAKKEATKVGENATSAVNNGKEWVTRFVSDTQNWITKSNVQSTIDKGSKTIADIFNKILNPEVTITRTSNLSKPGTKETITPKKKDSNIIERKSTDKKSDDQMINIKELSKENKKKKKNR